MKTSEAKSPEAGAQAAFAPFQISVMPKEYRGLEGLARPWYAGQDAPGRPQQTEPTEPAVIVRRAPTPDPTAVTPAEAVAASLQQPILPPRRVSRWVIWGSVVVVVLVAGASAWALLWNPSPAAPDRVPTPAVVPTTPIVQTPPVTPTPPAVAEPEPTVPLASGPLPGQDSDSDGLTDVEEVIYGTDVYVGDTDQDTFLDGNEVNHLYHPNALAPATLLDTGAVVEVRVDGFALYALSRWQRQVQADTNTVVLTAPTGEVFQVVPSVIAPAQTLQQWFDAQAGEGEDELEPFRTKQGYVGLLTEDRLTGYIRFRDDLVLICTYNVGRASRVQYRQTFSMLMNSLRTLTEL